MAELKWEEIKQDHAGYMRRAKVPGGWLVREVQDVQTLMHDGYGFENRQGWEWTSSICFVPDPNHEWQ